MYIIVKINISSANFYPHYLKYIKWVDINEIEYLFLRHGMSEFHNNSKCAKRSLFNKFSLETDLKATLETPATSPDFHPCDYFSQYNFQLNAKANPKHWFLLLEICGFIKIAKIQRDRYSFAAAA